MFQRMFVTNHYILVEIIYRVFVLCAIVRIWEIMDGPTLVRPVAISNVYQRRKQCRFNDDVIDELQG